MKEKMIRQVVLMTVPVVVYAESKKAVRQLAREAVQDLQLDSGGFDRLLGCYNYKSLKKGRKMVFMEPNA
jgi:hypothetical protein